ncbi:MULTISPECIES: hypothetical protein [unclassified Caballeronia]|uniref:hypothetical protein n=1 Tax=unclassified Caballeronia TaxID=2646786 RepID=UPI00285FA817|nr:MULTISPECIES: hypothetical protein [unclassified Caballeronia]MDR5755274.1 hypothetical protein [Caballeronia sp. LZ024]MDR5845120.1 hypothetical protein [Caballeronia sp. LZ031]
MPDKPRDVPSAHRAIHFYLIDLLHNVDYSPTGALPVLAAKSTFRVVNLFDKGAAPDVDTASYVEPAGRNMKAWLRKSNIY